MASGGTNFAIDEDVANFSETLDLSAALNDDFRPELKKKLRNTNDSPSAKPYFARSKRALQTPKIPPIPDGLPIGEVRLGADNYECFWGSDHFLSSFFRCSIDIGGVHYPSVEQYYQAAKVYALAGPTEASRLRTARDPFKAKSMAKEILRQRNVPISAVESWKRTQGLEALLYANGCKYIQHANLRQQLLATGEKLLVHAFAGDVFFACGMNKDEFAKFISSNSGIVLLLLNDMTLKHFPAVGRGQNILGVVLMKVRRLLMGISTAQVYDRNFVDELLWRMMR